MFSLNNSQSNPLTQHTASNRQVQDSRISNNHERDSNQDCYANTSSHYRNAARAANDSSSLQDTYRHQYPMSAEEKAVMDQLNSFLEQMHKELMISTISHTVGFGLSALLPIFFLGTLF